MSLILGIIERQDYHPTASEIFIEARKTLPGISLGTVYRNIDKLVESKKIIKFAVGENKYRYDFLHVNHDHIRCSCCGRVKDLKEIDVSGIKKQIQNESQFSDISIHMEILGACEQCSLEHRKKKP